MAGFSKGSVFDQVGRGVREEKGLMLALHAVKVRKQKNENAENPPQTKLG